ncbi:hypothetical protein DNTS_027958 [Danionella cerebrum]|uniref:rhomboid protease n=1 Tax=Danionella cerebrum TaxID=2873325 RepID=A0A553Q150_9TELE|nr:hypothetical protein DNTS_027958 [Danionella translucida]
MMALRASAFRWFSQGFLHKQFLSNRHTLRTQQRCGYRKVSKKNVVEETGPVNVAPSRSFSSLVKPFVFTVGFTGCSFAGAAIWQYENVKSRINNYSHDNNAKWLDKIRPQKHGDLRKQVNQWWNSLSEGNKTVTGIIAVNVLVFCCWRVPFLRRFGINYFTSNPSSKSLCWPMLLSTFSHYSPLHLAVNMYVLWGVSSTIINTMGKEQFLAFYLSAGVISSFASYVSKIATGRLGTSLGASGAILAVIAAVFTKSPEAKAALLFLPIFNLTCGTALKAIVTFDTMGMLLGWRIFDHAAHLGGALFGIWYILYGHQKIWKNRETLVRRWHDFRSRRPGSGGNGPI